MRALVLAVALALAVPGLPGVALAVQPDEILSDPALEARARALSAGLRCVVCRNENIDESNADLARDMRIVLRERLVAGDDDAEAVQFLVDRYGEYVLLRPRNDGINMVLWAAAPVLFLSGLALGAMALRRRPQAERPLSPEEAARLEELTRE